VRLPKKNLLSRKPIYFTDGTKEVHFYNRLEVRYKPNNHVSSAYTWSLLPRRKISLLPRVT